jgi:hypothetical protein
MATDPSPYAQYAVTIGLAGGAAATELISKYRDNPRRLFGLLSFYIYVGANAGAGALALLFIHAGLVNFGPDGSDWLIQALIAGAGALLLLRSAAVVVTDSSGREVQVGPGAAVSALLGLMDEIIKRNQARARASAVTSLMRFVDYDAAVENLPPLCLELMAKTSEGAVLRLDASVEKLKHLEAHKRAKVMMLGALMIDFCGKDVLAGALDTSPAVFMPTSSAPRADAGGS